MSLQQTGTPVIYSTPAAGSGGTITGTSALYLAGGTTTLTLTGHVPVGTPDGTTYENLVSVGASISADPPPVNNTASANVTVRPLIGGFVLSVSSITVDGTAGTVTITVLNPSGQTGTGQLFTQDGTARAGLDYGSVALTFTCAPGETSKSISIPIFVRHVGRSAPLQDPILALDDAAEPLEDADLFFALPSHDLPVQQDGHQLVTSTVVLSNPSPGTSLGARSALSVTIRHSVRSVVPSANSDDEQPRKETEEERRQRERTNRGGEDDYRIEGDVTDVACGDSPKTVTLVNRDGLVTVRLYRDAENACDSIRVGDYLTVEGEKIHELLFEATDVDIEERRQWTVTRHLTGAWCGCSSSSEPIRTCVTVY